MKEFIEQCFRDLEPLTGIRQLYFLETDPDGKRKLEVTIKGILLVCEQFSYIPEEAQKKIIRDQMVRDKDYDSFNSRTVWGWLDRAKDVWWEKHTRQEHNVQPEELSEETKKLINEYTASLLDGMQTEKKERVKFRDKLEAEIKRIREEDAARLQGKSVTDHKEFVSSEFDVQRKQLHLQWIRENFDYRSGEKLPGYMDEQDWINHKIERGEISL